MHTKNCLVFLVLFIIWGYLYYAVPDSIIGMLYVIGVILVWNLYLKEPQDSYRYVKLRKMLNELEDQTDDLGCELEEGDLAYKKIMSKLHKIREEVNRLEMER